VTDEHERANDWETGFTPRMVGDPPEPKLPKPRCAVEGCERVVYKSVVCKGHWDELPIEMRLRRAADALVAQQVAKADSDLAIMGWAACKPS
jgi:hypothetical protein